MQKDTKNTTCSWRLAYERFGLLGMSLMAICLNLPLQQSNPPQISLGPWHE